MNVQVPIRILVIEDDQNEVRRFELTAASTPDILLLGSVDSVPAALAFIREHPVDFAILDLELSNSHGIQLINALLDGEIEDPPHVIVITAVTGTGTLNAVHSKKVERIFWKGEDNYIKAGPQAVFEYIREIAPFCLGPAPVKNPVTGMMSEEMLRMKIEKELAQYGAAMGTKSTDYTVDAIIELTKLPHGYVNLKEEIYPKIMARRNARYKNVVNNIQYCITSMWDRLDQVSLSKSYTLNVDEARGMGEQKQVLLFFANKFRSFKARSI